MTKYIILLNDMRVTYFGLLRSVSSWAKVARELCLALSRAGADIGLIERKGFLFDAGFPLYPELEKRLCSDFGDIVFTFEHPRNYFLLPAGPMKVGLLVYEYTRLPDMWVESVEKHLDLVLVPSSFTREVFMRSGVPPKKVAVLRYGFNPEFYYPSGAAGNRDFFHFLCVSSPHRREGLRETISAFGKAFGGDGSARLTVKLSYVPKRGSKPFEEPCFRPFLEEAVKPGNVRIISENLNEAEMGALYRSCDCYFSLSRAESFGLPFLEAAACGKPSLTVCYGGQKDFLNDSNAYFADFGVEDVSEAEYEESGHPQFAAVPDMEDAVSLLRAVKEGGAVKSGEARLLPSPEHYHWESVAGDFTAILNSL